METKINVKKTVKETFILNGKRYNSLEEMPADVRAEYEKALPLVGQEDNWGIPYSKNSRYVINGREYSSVEEMPADVRQIYEEAMKAMKDGKESTIQKNEFQLSLGTPTEQSTPVNKLHLLLALAAITILILLFYILKHTLGLH